MMSAPTIIDYTVTNTEVTIVWITLFGANKGGDNVTIDSYDL